MYGDALSSPATEMPRNAPPMQVSGYVHGSGDGGASYKTVRGTGWFSPMVVKGETVDWKALVCIRKTTCPGSKLVSWEGERMVKCGWRDHSEAHGTKMGPLTRPFMHESSWLKTSTHSAT